jgi:hypothetical protein
MPNHVHLIVTPSDEDGLRATLAEVHRRYTGAINARFHWTGHLFQGRFGAAVMDEPHLLAAARYIALNPVAAGLVHRAEDWPSSSARAHLAGEDDELATVAPLRADPRSCRPSPRPGRPRNDSSDRARRRSDDRLEHPNGSRRSGAGLAAAWHPASPDQSREWTATPRGSRVCRASSSKPQQVIRHSRESGNPGISAICPPVQARGRLWVPACARLARGRRISCRRDFLTASFAGVTGEAWILRAPF